MASYRELRALTRHRSYEFKWWRVNAYGCAEPHPDTPEVRAAVDADPHGWYGSVEACIISGGVLATAFKRKTEPTYDAAHWLKTGERIRVGSVTITEITAEPAGTQKRVWSQHNVQ